MNKYPLMLKNGECGSQNLEEARKWFKKAAKKEHTVAMFNYALMLFKREGGSRNLKEARKET